MRSNPHLSKEYVERLQQNEDGCTQESTGPRNQIEAMEKEMYVLRQTIQEQKEELLSLYRRLHS